MKQLGCCKLSHWKEMKVNLIKLKISVNSLLCSLYKPAMKDSGAIIMVINNNCCVTTFTFHYEITSTVYVKKEENKPCLLLGFCI